MNLDEFGDVIKNLGLSTSKDQLKTLMKEIDLDGKKIEASKLKYSHCLLNSFVLYAPKATVKLNLMNLQFGCLLNNRIKIK